jgi:hypothetical protein
MIQCAAVRRKGSAEQCSAKAVTGHTLCGRHVRCRDVQLWKDTRDSSNVTRFQSLFRGWMVRRRLELAGPGVLCRKNLANTEDVVTCEENVSPMDYFAFVENDKTWWFDFSTIWTWCQKSRHPVNPYTKVPLSPETRKRLRSLWAYRRRHREKVPSEANTFEDRLRGRWNILCQAFEDNGFVDVHPNQFMRLNKSQLCVAFRFLRADLQVSMRKTDPMFDKFMSWTLIRIQRASHLSTVQYLLQSSYVLMMMVCAPADPYITIFTILSALHRC